MKRWMRLAAAACVAVALLGSTSLAQNEGGRRGGGGRGFAEGLGTRAPNAFSFVTNEAVQIELSLTEEQATKVKAISGDFGNSVFSRMPDGGFFGRPGDDVTVEERQKRRLVFQAAINAAIEEHMPKLDQAISADQMKRLDEIVLQAKGTGALSDEVLAKALELSDEQTAKIADANKQYDDTLRELGGIAGAGLQKTKELRDERDKAIMDTLTLSQKDQFAQMQGRQFDLSKLRPVRPGSARSRSSAP